MNKKPKIFYEADQGGASGSESGEAFSTTAAEVFEPSTPPSGTEPEETGAGGGDGSDAGAVGAGTKPPSQALTPEQITAAVRAGVTPPDQPKQYTQEELDQIFKVWKPDEDLVRQLLAGGQEALGALVVMREGLAGQFGQLVQYQMEILRKELQDRYNPMESHYKEVRAAKDREDFFKQNEDLREHENIVDIAYKSLLGESRQYPTLAEAQKALADRAKQLIPNGTRSGTPPSGGARNTTTATKPRPATLSGGSQAGGSGGTSAPPNVFHEIFGSQ